MAAILELYLIRHAIAAERGPKYPDDRKRPLTPEGIKRFKESVRGLVELGVGLDFCGSSPLTRAEVTAAGRIKLKAPSSFQPMLLTSLWQRYPLRGTATIPYF